MKNLLKTSLVATILIISLATGLLAKVIGSGSVTTETRSVSGFHSVELLCSGNVVITQGETEGLVVEAEDNIIPLVETKVTEGGTLRISFKAGEEIHYNKPLTVKVSAKTLDALSLIGSGDISSKELKADHLAIKLLGSGDVSVNHLETGALTVAINGSGDVKLAGKAANQTVNVAGSGDYNAADLKTGEATLNIPGSGDCEVAASETLTVNISGSGDVGYYGTPKVTKRVNGSGNVHALGAGK